MRNHTILPCLTAALVFAISQRASAIPPRPASTNAQWAGQSWGELQLSPPITKASNSVSARAIVRGGPAGNPSWHCSQYSGWVAAGTSSIYIVIPDDWTFTTGGGYVRPIGGKAKGQQSEAGDPPPYGWADRVSDTCYCYVETFGASGGCDTREVKPTFASTYQDEILAAGASSRWVRITALFGGWNGVGHSDEAEAYLYVLPDDSEPEDTDDDGIDDRWEIACFGDLTTADENSNYDDGDNISDFIEFSRWNGNTLDGDGAQYDPTVPNSETDHNDGGGSAPACSGVGPITLPMILFGLTLLNTAGRHRRRRSNPSWCSPPNSP